MGMAASQARYLQITARKINTEYEGQQINQQRTMLANESAGLFSQLMALEVPTAPSSTDFTELQYTFSDGIHNYTISDIEELTTTSADYNAHVTYYYTDDVATGIDKERTDMGVLLQGSNYWLVDATGTKLTQLESIPTETEDEETYKEDMASILQICKDNPSTTFATDAGFTTVGGVATVTTPENIRKYESSGDGTTYYMGLTQLNEESTLGTVRDLDLYYEKSLSQKIYNDQDAYLETTENGRFSEIKLADTKTTFDLTSSTTTNSLAYADALNEYEYKKSIYDKEVSDINAQTEVIEQEDRVLELKLARLDTEQEALQTELEAVKKVIDKNIEETFKTFSS